MWLPRASHALEGLSSLSERLVGYLVLGWPFQALRRAHNSEFVESMTTYSM
nr:MAG TPA: hypothetical protein [Caudoviricetes sp.]